TALFLGAIKKAARKLPLSIKLKASLPAGNFLQRFTDLRQGAHGFDTGIFQGGKLLISRAFATGDNGAGLPHTLAFGCGNTGNIGNHRLGDIGFDKGRSLFFRSTANFTDHDNGFGGGIILEQLENIDKVGTGNRVAADAHTGGLTKTVIRSLLDRFIGQGTGTGNNAHFARQVNMAGHNTDFTFAWSDNPWAVGADQTHAQLITFDFAVEHIEGGNTFGDTNDEFDTGVRCFENGILAERCG